MTLTILYNLQMMEPLHVQLCNIVPIVRVIPGNCGIPLTTIFMRLAYVVAKYNTEHISSINCICVLTEIAITYVLDFSS